MDWTKIVLNVVGSAAAALLAQHVLPDSVSPYLIAVVAVLAGLVQEQPHK